MKDKHMIYSGVCYNEQFYQ